MPSSHRSASRGESSFLALAAGASDGRARMLIGTTSNILVVNPALPVRSIAELIAHGKVDLGKLSYSTPAPARARAANIQLD